MEILEYLPYEKDNCCLVSLIGKPDGEMKLVRLYLPTRILKLPLALFPAFTEKTLQYLSKKKASMQGQNQQTPNKRFM